MTPLVLFATCLVAAVLPVAGSEVLVLGAAAVADGAVLAMIIVAAAAAQSIGKLVVYGAAAAGTRTWTGDGFGIGALKTAIGRSCFLATAIVFASALASVPPLYATTLVCGAARHGPARFAVTVFVARILRYSVLALILDAGWTVA